MQLNLDFIKQTNKPTKNDELYYITRGIGYIVFCLALIETGKLTLLFNISGVLKIGFLLEIEKRSVSQVWLME